MENDRDIRFRKLMTKLGDNGKCGIRLPLKEEEANKHIGLLKQFLEIGMISGELYEKGVKDINSRSLDEETYKEFYDVLKS